MDEGEFVKEVTWKDMLAGGMDAAFGYVTGSLKDVTFEIYAAEDIKAADGESSDYYKKDELVATITTDALGYARSEDLPLGKYYVKEKETADGYVLDGEIREVDLTYRDQNTPVVTYDEDWQNNRQKAKVTVVKKEKISFDDENGVRIFNVEAECNIENVNESDINNSEKILEKVIKENLENTINKARELNADFIGVTDDGNMGSKSFKINADVKIIGTGVIK